MNAPSASVAGCADAPGVRYVAHFPSVASDTRLASLVASVPASVFDRLNALYGDDGHQLTYQMVRYLLDSYGARSAFDSDARDAVRTATVFYLTGLLRAYTAILKAEADVLSEVVRRDQGAITADHCTVPEISTSLPVSPSQSSLPRTMCATHLAMFELESMFTEALHQPEPASIDLQV